MQRREGAPTASGRPASRRHRGERALARVACLVTGLIATACSYRFDADPPWETVGTPVDARGLQQVTIPRIYAINACHVVGYPLTLLEARDGAPWIAYQDRESDLAYRLVRLAEPGASEGIPGEPLDVHLGQRAVLLSDTARRDVIFHWLGEHREDRFHLTGQEDSCCAIGTSQDEEVFWWPTATTEEFQRTDGSYHFRIEFEAGPGGTVDRGTIWTFDDAVVWIVGDRLRVHSTRSDEFFDDTVPARAPMTIYYDKPTRALFRCDEAGLARVPIDGSPRTQIDATCRSLHVQGTDIATPSGEEDSDCDHDPAYIDSPCQSAGRRLAYLRAFDSQTRHYTLASVPLDGGAPQVVPDYDNPGYLLDLCGTHIATYDRSYDWFHGERYSLPLRVDGRAVAERGRGLRFSRDGTRVRFLDATATLVGSGTLMAGPPEGPYEPIARNVLRYDELGDGRIIAAIDLPYVGLHNRVVLLDERRRVLQRFVDGARDYRLIPGGREVMVRLVTPNVDNAVEPMTWVRAAIPPAP